MRSGRTSSASSMSGLTRDFHSMRVYRSVRGPSVVNTVWPTLRRVHTPPPEYSARRASVIFSSRYSGSNS